MLISSLIDRFLLQLSESTTSPIYLSRSESLQLVNSTTRTLAHFLDCYRTLGVCVCKANVPKYYLDNDIRTLMWVMYDSKVIHPGSRLGWTKNTRTWIDKTGTPTEYALDIEKRNILWLNPAPSSDGDEFLFTSTSGVPYAIIDPYSVNFDAQTQDFTTGQTATGSSSGSSAEIIHVVQDGYSGTLYFESNPGTFTDNESITDGLGGSATINGTTTDGATNTWTWSRSYGLVHEITGGDDYWNIIDLNGDNIAYGEIDEIFSPINNVVYCYSYYPYDRTETQHLLSPYREEEETYLTYMMYQALMIEAEGQDIQRALMYLTRFSSLAGIEMHKLWTPQGDHTVREYGTQSSTPRQARLPDEYGATEY